MCEMVKYVQKSTEICQKEILLTSLEGGKGKRSVGAAQASRHQEKVIARNECSQTSGRLAVPQANTELCQSLGLSSGCPCLR